MIRSDTLNSDWKPPGTLPVQLPNFPELYMPLNYYSPPVRLSPPSCSNSINAGDGARWGLVVGGVPIYVSSWEAHHTHMIFDGGLGSGVHFIAPISAFIRIPRVDEPYLGSYPFTHA